MSDNHDEVDFSPQSTASPGHIMPEEKHAEDTWSISPDVAYFWQNLLLSPWAMGVILLFAFTIAARAAFSDPEAPLILQHIATAARWIDALEIIYIGTYFSYKWACYKRLSYVFSSIGFRIEGGLLEHQATWLHWSKVSSVSVFRSLPEQFANCGTVRVGIDQDSHVDFHFVKDYCKLQSFFQSHVDANLASARRINSL